MNKQIFLVDDDPYWTALLTQMLFNLHYHDVTTFSNGTDFLEHLYLEPAIVFLDYQMDDLNGIEVLKEIKRTHPEIGVIFCTAYEDLSVAVHAIDNGSCDYLLKGNATTSDVGAMIDAVSVETNFLLKYL